jgi:hypothetical protein
MAKPSHLRIPSRLAALPKHRGTYCFKVVVAGDRQYLKPRKFTSSMRAIGSTPERTSNVCPAFWLFSDPDPVLLLQSSR